MSAPLKTNRILLAAVASPALALSLATPASAAPVAAHTPAHVVAANRSGLKPVALHARQVVAKKFRVSNIGGYRPGRGKSDHHTGRAIDIMVRGAKGDQIAAWVKKNSRALNVKYVIWEQTYWQPGMRKPRHMANRGSATANHFDHVHVSFRR